MALWGNQTGLANTPGFNAGAGEAKPTWQINWDPVDAKGRANNINHNRQTFANTQGWTEEITYTDSNGNSRIRSELLVAISSPTGLAADLGEPTITDVSFGSDQITSTITSSNNVILKVTYNEPVYVSGYVGAAAVGDPPTGSDPMAQLVIFIGNGTPGTTGTSGGNISNACYFGVGNGTNTLEFSMTASAKGGALADTNAGGGGTGELSIIGTKIMRGGESDHTPADDPIITSVGRPVDSSSNRANTWFDPSSGGHGYRTGAVKVGWTKPSASLVSGSVGGGATIGANVTVLAVV
tara:strand:- start:1757 stop:2644 length:888 start_codon:yes stop_codon:yes gene_type:complete